MLRIRTQQIVAILFLFCTCSQNREEPAVARVGDKVLYLSELKSILPNDISGDDSSLMAEDYTKKWVKHQLTILKAEENLSNEQKDVTKELEEYRNSLIIYKYKNSLLAQKMDTVVTVEEINSYYEVNREDYMLNLDIVKGVYIKMPIELNNSEQIIQLCNELPESKEVLNELCLRYAKKYDRFHDSWVNLSTITEYLPDFEINNLQHFLRITKFYQTDDENFNYYVCIYDYKLSGEPAPVEFVSEKVKNVILNRRKIEFLKKIEEDIYKDGLRNNKFTIYDI